MKRLASRLLIVMLATLSVFAFALPAQAATGDEQSVTWRVNHEHYTRNMRSLQSWESIVGKARQHSCEMAKTQRLFHTPNLSSQYSGWRILGENVAMGYNLYEIHKAWMQSPAHRSNILESRYRAMGSGVCRDSGGTYWVTTVFFG